MLKPGRPRHEQISDWLREQIHANVYGPDEQIPSESQLTERFSVSRITVRRALHTLESENLIYRRQGLGSFVQTTRVRQGLVRLNDFVEDMAQEGLEACSEVLHFAPEQAPSDVASALELTESQTVARLDRLRLGNNAPIAYDQTWLPLFYAQLLEGRDLQEDTIYRILEQEYEIPIKRGRFRIEAVNAPARIARPLAVPVGRAVLLISRTSFTHGDKRVYYQRRYYRNDRVAYELELRRDPNTSDPNRQDLPIQAFEPVFKPFR